MTTTVFDVLKKQIQDEITVAAAFVDSGAATDYANYKETTGLIRGLDTSLRIIEDLSRTYMDDDDD